jgi:hypothetical protein
MNNIKISIALIMSGLFINTYAQNNNEQASTSVKKYNYYLGVQANELFRQLLPIGSSNNTSLLDPYLLTFQMHSKRTNWGLRTAANYTLKNFVDEDAANKKVTNINMIHLKVGAEKFIHLGSRFNVGYGADVVWDFGQNYTVNELTAIDTTISTTNSITNAIGLGPGIRLTYQLSNRVHLGTEFGLYFVQNNNTTKFAIKSISQTTGTTQSFEESTNSKANVNTRLPASLYLIIKL